MGDLRLSLMRHKAIVGNESTMEFRMGELFCGPGGIALGAHMAAAGLDGVTVKHAWANDYDLSTCETYIANIPGATAKSVRHGDVRTLDLEKLGPIDGFAFGFPCNDFSLVGQQKGTDGVFGPLYTYGVKVLNEYSPKWFVAENVGGLTSSNEGQAFLTILNALSEAGSAGGYKLYPHKYKFEEYGFPQARHRILIVGIRADLETEFKVPSTEPYKHVDNTAGSRLTNPPIPMDAQNNELTKQSPVVIERLQHIKPGENAFTANLPNHLKLNVSGAKISQIYKRLRADKPSYTITGSGGGGTHVYHWSEPRALTNRERARLQTFPDDFVFKGSKENVRKQIGMAVPVEGAAVVFEALFKSFKGQRYEAIEPNLSKFLVEAENLKTTKK
jgi:DNA (cytosine-5)-methyltransferase 1